ncbi:unnamed protein product, partial [Discosporangium mesarthrocarpum]
LAQETYDAQLAGLSYGVSQHRCGFAIEVSGFGQKIRPLLERV